MRYEILGSLRVVDGQGAVSVISAQKRQTLLATLLIRADQAVSSEQLIAELWGEHPPRRAQAALHVYISQLRKSLGAERIATLMSGYCLRTDGDTVDVREFQAGLDRGRARMRERHYEEAVAAFDEGLRLWRGTPLPELREAGAVHAFTTWLEENRMEALELAAEADLALGRHRDLVSRLSPLLVDHPLHEAFYRQLMLALYRSERRADALRTYQRARKVLDEELGLEPGRALQDLHRRILTSDQRLDLVPAR